MCDWCIYKLILFAHYKSSSFRFCLYKSFISNMIIIINWKHLVSYHFRFRSDTFIGIKSSTHLKVV